jgi:hypothetical protein
MATYRGQQFISANSAAEEILMKFLITAIAMVALLGFVTSAHAKDAKPKPGHFVKVDGMELTYKGGAKGTGKEHTVKIDDKTKITLDGKEAKVTDLKADMYIEVTAEKDVASLIAASTTPPKK